ncbi:hypothetical protein ACT8ZV_08805 [Nocardioides sp. MAHUQ-72]|uniref:hypothetical protein n=1 Tax=unclassified Nocardioides TaxID=2615069 RepID=UPI00361F9717
MFRSVAATYDEVARPLPGDELVPDAGVVMDRAFTLAAPVARVWPWFVQLGKQRAGWYLPRQVERAVPAGRRALRRVDPALQLLEVGDVIADWGGRDATFTVARLEPPRVLVHTSRRGRVDLSWAIVLREAPPGTRVQLRLRLSGVRRPRLARTLGGLVDAVTVAALAAGLRERVGPAPGGRAQVSRAPR